MWKKNPSYSGETSHPQIYNSGRKHIYWSKLHKPRAFFLKKKHAATYNKIEHTKIHHLLGIKILTINCHFIVLNDIKEEFLLFSFRKLFVSNIMTMMLEKFQQQFQFYILPRKWDIRLNSLHVLEASHQTSLHLQIDVIRITEKRPAETIELEPEGSCKSLTPNLIYMGRNWAQLTQIMEDQRRKDSLKQNPGE